MLTLYFCMIRYEQGFKSLAIINAEREKFTDTQFEWFTWLANRIRDFVESEKS